MDVDMDKQETFESQPQQCGNLTDRFSVPRQVKLSDQQTRKIWQLLAKHNSSILSILTQLSPYIPPEHQSAWQVAAQVAAWNDNAKRQLYQIFSAARTAPPPNPAMLQYSHLHYLALEYIWSYIVHDVEQLLNDYQSIRSMQMPQGLDELLQELSTTLGNLCEQMKKHFTGHDTARGST